MERGIERESRVQRRDGVENYLRCDVISELVKQAYRYCHLGWTNDGLPGYLNKTLTSIVFFIVMINVFSITSRADLIWSPVDNIIPFLPIINFLINLVILITGNILITKYDFPLKRLYFTLALITISGLIIDFILYGLISYYVDLPALIIGYILAFVILTIVDLIIIKFVTKLKFNIKMLLLAEFMGALANPYLLIIIFRVSTGT